LVELVGEREENSKEASGESKENFEEETKLVIVCVIAALAGIAVLVAYARANKPTVKSIEELSSEDAGRLVLVKARVESLSVKQNAFLKICAVSCITTFIPKQVLEKMNTTTLDLNSLKKGAVVSVEGVVEEHANKLELRVLTPNAIEFLGYERETR